jgi:hypothetical protein
VGHTSIIIAAFGAGLERVGFLISHALRLTNSIADSFICYDYLTVRNPIVTEIIHTSIY